MDDSMLSDEEYDGDSPEIFTFPADALPCPGEDGLKIAYGSQQTFTVYCDEYPYTANQNRQLHDDLQIDICRDMLQQFHTIFINLQSSIHALGGFGVEGSELQRRHEVSIASRGYFEALILAVTKLRQSDDSNAAEKLDEVARMWMVWHLAHILFVVSVRGASVQKYLREWMGLHTPVDPAAPFWDKVTRYLLIGNIDMALRELAEYRKGDGKGAPEVTALEQIVRAMPLFDENDSMTKRHEWNRWRDFLLSKTDDLKAGQVPDGVIGVLSGDAATLRGLCSNWYEYGVAQIMYVSPWVRASNLSDLVSDWMANMNTDEADFDEVLASIFEHDAAKLLVRCNAFFKSSWYTAHLADILGHVGVFGLNDHLRYGSDLREWFILEYGTDLMEIGQGLALFGADYLGACRVFGQQRLAACLSRLVPADELELQMLLLVCKKHGLVDSERLLCARMGTSLYRQQRFGEALLWYIQAGDECGIQQSADKLAGMAINGSEKDNEQLLSLVDLLARHGGYSGRVLFVVRYHQFRAAMDEQRYGDAGQTLIKMFRDGIVPMEHRNRLMFNDADGQYDAMTLLQRDIGAVDAADASFLLRELEGQRLFPTARPYEKDAPVHQDRVLKFRTLISRNLAHTIVAIR